MPKAKHWVWCKNSRQRIRDRIDELYHLGICHPPDSNQESCRRTRRDLNESLRKGAGGLRRLSNGGSKGYGGMGVFRAFTVLLA